MKTVSVDIPYPLYIMGLFIAAFAGFGGFVQSMGVPEPASIVAGAAIASVTVYGIHTTVEEEIDESSEATEAK